MQKYTLLYRGFASALLTAALGLGSVPAMAHDYHRFNGSTILGGAVGAGAGAAVGSAVAGREGAIIGSALGAATGVVIATPQHGYYGRDHYYVNGHRGGKHKHHHRHHHHHWD